jgi:hypothetical protein
MLGLDIYDAIIVLRTDEAVASFASHKVTIGGEIALAAGAYGTGASVEAGKDRQPITAFVRSRGLYAGVEVVAQAFLARFDEKCVIFPFPLFFLCRANFLPFHSERVYHWPGVSQGDIVRTTSPLPACSSLTFVLFVPFQSSSPLDALGRSPSLFRSPLPISFLSVLFPHPRPHPHQLSGRVRAPREAEPFYAALSAAEDGTLQRSHGADKEFEEADVEYQEALDDLGKMELGEGETLRLPPTPDQLEREEEEEEWKKKKAERDNLRYLR